jgi:hypothetical protein
MKRKIRLDICDFWWHEKSDNFFYKLLSERFDVRLCDRPDFLLYSNNGCVHRLHNCRKIFYTHEPIPPDFRQCDFAFTSFHIDDPRHMRLPWYAVLYDSPGALIRSGDDPPPQQILAEKTRFCSFLVSGYSRRKNRNRLEIFQKLSKYKPVDSGGKFMNNIGGPLPGGVFGKIGWMRQYKFHIAFENASLPGYTTEKLPQALMARTLPIYWGDPRVAEDFNPRSFINAADYPDLDALVEKVIEVDKDDSLWLKYLSEECLPHNQPTVWYDRTRLLDQFERIFDTTGPSVSVRRRAWRPKILGRWVIVKRNDLK